MLILSGSDACMPMKMLQKEKFAVARKFQQYVKCIYFNVIKPLKLNFIDVGIYSTTLIATKFIFFSDTIGAPGCFFTYDERLLTKWDR